jgi:DNA-directed RNA polymerase subunit alpha
MHFEPSQKPKQIVIDNESITNSYAKFIAEPFERGFGHTLGNSLRRILLSSISGASIVALKIEGVEHEFSTIPGIREDVTDIIFNIKKIILKMHTDEPKYLKLNVKKKGDVIAGDIETDADVEILNPDVHIATLGSKTELNIEILALRGYGYIPSERNEFIQDLAVGWIPVDAVFSPIVKINYIVQETRIGQITDYDRLTLEVWTNGSIHPSDAVVEAAKILQEHVDLFVNFKEGSKEDVQFKQEGSEKLLEILSKPIEEMELSVRSHNCLKNANILSIADLVLKTDAEMLRTRNFGRKSLNEIKEVLHEMNLSLGMNLDAFPQFKKTPEESQEEPVDENIEELIEEPMEEIPDEIPEETQDVKPDTGKKRKSRIE